MGVHNCYLEQVVSVFHAIHCIEFRQRRKASADHEGYQSGDVGIPDPPPLSPVAASRDFSAAATVEKST